ncbi:MAG: hypothetical protein HN893_09215, partial [Rhodospirillales bacterium]|nr:hypothetical protein [Rhodospirillales bacterium]
VFLTLVLANLIEDMEALERRLEEEGCAWNDMFGDQLHDLQALLREQEIYNAAHPPAVVREGAVLFRAWLVMSDGLPTTMTKRNDYVVLTDHMTAPAAE